MPGGTRQYCFLTLTLTRKFFELSGHAGVTLTDHVCAPSNGFPAAVYDSIGPTIGVHDRQWRYPLAPRASEPSAQSRGGGAVLRTNGWPSASILRSAPKSWVSAAKESSHRSIKKAVEKTLTAPTGGFQGVPVQAHSRVRKCTRAPTVLTGHAQHFELADEITEDDCAVAGHCSIEQIHSKRSTGPL